MNESWATAGLNEKAQKGKRINIYKVTVSVDRMTKEIPEFQMQETLF